MTDPGPVQSPPSGALLEAAIDAGPPRRHGSRRLAAIIALAYGVVMTLVVTPVVAKWGGDYAMYIEQIDGGRFGEIVALLAAQDPLAVLSGLQVVLFFFLFVALGSTGLATTTSLALVSALSATVIGYFTFSRSRNKWFAVFLLSPFVLDLVFFQVRNGFALALFLAGLMLLPRAPRRAYAVFFLAILFHYAMALFLAVYFGAARARRLPLRSKDLLTAVTVSALAGLSIAMTYLYGSTFNRYYIREGFLTESSVTGVLFFLSLIGLYVVAGQGFIRRYQFEFLLGLILLWIYPVFGQALRVFATSLPLHLAALSNARRTYASLIVLFVLFVFNVVQWDPLFSYLGG